MFGKRYVWILTGSAIYTSWVRNVNTTRLTCTKEQILEAANGYITLDFKNMAVGMELNHTISGMVISIVI